MNILLEIVRVRDVFDVLIVTFLTYLVLLLLRRAHSTFILGGIIILFLVYALAYTFQLFLTTILLQYFFTFSIFILVVIFQRELRNFFEWIFILGVSRGKKRTVLAESTGAAIIETVKYLAPRRIGALIVLTSGQPIDRFLDGGYVLNGALSMPLLLSIFDPSSPGHDGAVIVEGDTIKKFGVHLPLAERTSSHRDLGTRHRAALGLSERSDALVIAVSEERGTISLARSGSLSVISDLEVLENAIESFRGTQPIASSPWHRFITRNIMLKATALAVAIFLWLVFVYQHGNIPTL